MSIYKTLKAIRDFERRQLAFMETIEDRDLVCEIGYHQNHSEPLTLTRLLALELGSASTVQRRLVRLRELGVVRQRQSKIDRRANILSLSPAVLKIYQRLTVTVAKSGA